MPTTPTPDQLRDPVAARQWVHCLVLSVAAKWERETAPTLGQTEQEIRETARLEMLAQPEGLATRVQDLDRKVKQIQEVILGKS